MDKKEIIKKLQPYIALVVLSLIISSTYLLYQEVQQNKEIINNCGFTTDKWSCVCTQEAVNYYNGNVTLNFNDSDDEINPLLKNINQTQEINPLLKNINQTQEINPLLKNINK